MEKTSILVIDRDEAVLDNVLRRIASREAWEAIGARTDEEAIEKFQQHHFDIMLLAGSISSTAEAKLRKLFLFQHPDLIIVRHDNGNGQLFDEIEFALEQKKSETRRGISIVDDALKNAGLDIRIE